MKFALYLSFFLFYLILIDDKSFSLNDYEIKKICEKEILQSSCRKKMQQKRSNLEKGNLIEIPVIPYKK